MLETKFIELILRGFPETFIALLVSHLILRKPICKKDCIISSILFASVGFLIRLLPIHYGVHIILNVFTYIIILVNILKFNFNKAVSASIITFMLQITSEAINVFIINKFAKTDINVIFSNPICKIIYGLPSIIIMIMFSFLYYTYLKKRKVY